MIYIFLTFKVTHTSKLNFSLKNPNYTKSSAISGLRWNVDSVINTAKPKFSYKIQS